VLDTLFHALIRYAAPVLVFTSEEVWGTRYPEGGSVHLLEWPEVLDHSATNEPRDQHSDITERWNPLRNWRSKVTEAIEPLRREKVLGSSLEADVELGLLVPFPPDVDESSLNELFITASVRKTKDVTVVKITRTTHHKCGRCWRHLPEVTEDGALCSRCDQVVSGMEAAE
jgi:isoleucyl-tRNA synthetase